MESGMGRPGSPQRESTGEERVKRKATAGVGRRRQAPSAKRQQEGAGGSKEVNSNTEKNAPRRPPCNRRAWQGRRQTAGPAAPADIPPVGSVGRIPWPWPPREIPGEEVVA
jgi:hypothetical protein